MTDILTAIKPGDEPLVAAVTNLVLGRKRSITQNQLVWLDADDVAKIHQIIQILNTPGVPAEVKRYGQPASDTIPTGDDLAEQLGDTARRGLRARLDGQQPVPKE